jgi:glycosyltransferase involved in cell wall biosynthesis
VRILFLTRSLNVGGAERQLVALARALHLRGVVVDVAVFYSGGALEKDLIEAGVPVTSLRKKGRWDNIGFAYRLIRLLRRSQPDIVHSYLSVPNVVAVLARQFARRARVVLGVRASKLDLSDYGALTAVSCWVEAILSRFADLTIANSQTGRDHAIKHGFPKSNTIVIPNGIDTSYFFRDLTARIRVRTEWKISDDCFLVGMIGRLDPMKGHLTFLDAAAHVARETEEGRFVLIGDGPRSYKNRLISKINDLGLRDKVIWAGERRDMPAVYSALDIMCSPSSYGEGFPNVVGEAMSCKVPCIVTDVGDAAQIVGDTGKIVPPNDEVALCRAICETLNELRTLAPGSIGDQARRRIVDYFTVERLVSDTSEVLDRLLRTGASS